MLEVFTSEIKTRWFNPTWSTFLLRELLKNEDFKNDFILQYSIIGNTILSTDYLSERINTFKGLYEKEMLFHFSNRRMFQRHQGSILKWYKSIDDLIYFAKNRPGVQTANFRIGDAMALPFESDQFDFATMALVIRFVPDPAQGVAEMKRVVRPGGAVAAYVWDSLGGGMPHEPIQAELRSMSIKYPRPPSAEASNLEVLQKLWVDAGLRSVETQIITAERTFASFENFWSLSSNSQTLQSVLEDLDPATLGQLKSSIQARLTAETNGQITYSAHVNAIKGLV
jgi:ubiquinone/menaquinone biosynthesis C-methylase UbiE